MKLKYLVVLPFVGYCLSCTKSADGLKNVNISINEKTIEYSELCATTNVIQLSTSDSTLVGEVSQVRLSDDYVYVLYASKIFRFNRDGSFCDYLNKLGEAPDEYLSITDFAIEGDSCVWICSHNGMQLKKYNWDGKKLSASIDLSVFPGSVENLDDDNLLIYTGYVPNDYHSRVLKINKNDSKVSAYLPNESSKSKYMFIQANTIFNVANENRAYVNELFNDTLYKVEANDIRPFMRLDFGGKNIPESYYDEPISNIADFFQRIWAKNYAYGTSFVIPAEHNFYVSYYYNKKMHIAVIDKETMSCTADFTAIANVSTTSAQETFDIDLTETESFVDAKSGTIIFVLDGDADEQIKDPNPKLVLMQLE